jgi:hypothetical protein
VVIEATYGWVRHEAPSDRVGCKDPPAACRSRPLKLKAADPGGVGKGGSSLDNAGTGWLTRDYRRRCRDVRAAAAGAGRRGGIAFHGAHLVAAQRGIDPALGPATRDYVASGDAFAFS